MSDQPIILVTGVTGQQGGAVARELLAHGHRVRAMTRKPEGEKARALAGRGATVVQGDLDDAASLERALQGVWGVFALQNTWEAGVEREQVQGKRLAEQAKRAGVQHFVYASVGSAHRRTGIPHFDNKWRVEETVRQLGFPSYTILRPVFFMENFLSPLQMIALGDIGKYGRWAFEQPEKLNGRAIDIAGDARTMPEAARVIGGAAGRRVEFVPVPIEEVRKFSEDYAIMLEWFDRVGYDVDIEGQAQEAGIRPTTLAEWAAKVSWL